MLEEEVYRYELKRLIDETRAFDRFLSGSGCCVICYNHDPTVLVEHHVAGRNNFDITVTMCANDHARITLMQKSWPKNWTSNNNSSIAREAFLFLGLSDLHKIKSSHLFEEDSKSAE